LIKEDVSVNNTSKYIPKPKRPQAEKRGVTQIKPADLSKTSVEKQDVKPIKVNQKVVPSKE
jgi:hypothetical protein